MSFLLLSGLTSWMAGTSTLGSNFGRPCQWPWQTMHSTSFHPCSKACWNISWSIMKWWGLSASHLACLSWNSSTSISHSVSWTDKPSLSAHTLGARDLSLLLPYLSVSNLWYLKKIREHYSTWNWQHGQNKMTTWSPGQAHGWATIEAQLQTISTLQQFTEMHYFSVQASPTNLPTYFIMF